jgi:hypothetical protein
VPQLRFRLWFQPSQDRTQREQARQNALTSAPPPNSQPVPLPVQYNARAREPYGWQVSVRWDLVEMAEAVHPSLSGSMSQLTPTGCLQDQDVATRLLLESSGLEGSGLDGSGLGGNGLEHPSDD